MYVQVILSNQFNHTTFLCQSQTRTKISNIIWWGLLCVQWVKVGDNCSFCWYWWNCRQLLCKLL